MTWSVTGRRAVVRGCATTLLALCLPVHAHAQVSAGRRVAVDTVIGAQDFFAETRDWPTSVVLDPFVSVELRRNLQLAVRPKIWRANGDWGLLLDQASVQYSVHAGVNWRIEVGRFPSPIGLAMTENRPNVNAGLLWCHRPYYMPLPHVGHDDPMVSLVSATYPSGASVAASSEAWDVRAALVDTAPVQFWHGETGADRKVHVVAGAGVTPRQGLRFGLAVAQGDLTRGPAGEYRLWNVEGDYSFGYTRVSGEVTHDSFSMPSGEHEAWGWTVQAQHTLAPRVFLHARATSIHAPVPRTGEPPHTRPFRSLDTTLGYRIDPEVTVRAGYSAVRSWTASTTDHQVGLSLIWSRRWW